MSFKNLRTELSIASELRCLYLQFELNAAAQRPIVLHLQGSVATNGSKIDICMELVI